MNLQSIFILDEEEERIKILKDKIPLRLTPKMPDENTAEARSGRKKRKFNSISTNANIMKRRKQYFFNIFYKLIQFVNANKYNLTSCKGSAEYGNIYQRQIRLWKDYPTYPSFWGPRTIDG